jgi:hypothetical protein
MAETGAKLMKLPHAKLILGAGLATLIAGAGPDLLAKATGFPAHPKLHRGKPRKLKTKRLIKGAR